MDSKDHSNGLSSPPLSFLSEAFLTSVKDILCPNGMGIKQEPIKSVTTREHVSSIDSEIQTWLSCYNK